MRRLALLRAAALVAFGGGGGVCGDRSSDLGSAATRAHKAGWKFLERIRVKTLIFARCQSQRWRRFLRRPFLEGIIVEKL